MALLLHPPPSPPLLRSGSGSIGSGSSSIPRHPFPQLPFSPNRYNNHIKYPHNALLIFPYHPNSRGIIIHRTTRKPPRATSQLQHTAISCKLSRLKESPPPPPTTTSSSLASKEPHKYFDHVFITVRSGDGGHGAVLSMPKQKDGSNRGASKKKRYNNNKKSGGSYKRDSDGSLILPMGGHGGDVFIYADEDVDSLLEFHRKSRFNAKKGGHVDAMGVLTPLLHDGTPAPTLHIPVPLGTVVKHKRGKLLADLVHPGDEVLVARGGQGGISLLEMSEPKRRKVTSFANNVMRDESDKILVLGQTGEEVSLELILRVVADVGLVGLPNAGKSTLLAGITHARPNIADYPFTTLMPNLGRLDGDPSLGALEYSTEATLADLPGLIKDAHRGKGLGRNFLRHLRRTRLLVHVVDASAEDPINDYRTVREELRMYNPTYVERPFVVILNKIDLPEAHNRMPSLIKEISNIGCSGTWDGLEKISSGEISPFIPANDHVDHQSLGSSDVEEREKEIEDYPRPLAVVGTGLLKGIGIDEMLKEIRAALRKCQ